jgi:hypothetical protein
MTATHSAYFVTYGMSTNTDTIARTTSATESQNVHPDGVCMVILPRQNSDVTEPLVVFKCYA